MIAFRPARLLPGIWLLLLAIALACTDDATRARQHLERARAYAAQGDDAEALFEFRAALQYAPNDAEVHRGLALSLLEQGELADAAWELQEVVRLEPADLESRLRLGRALLMGGEPELEVALAQADAVLEAEPENRVPWLTGSPGTRSSGTVVRALTLKGRVLHQMRRADEAAELYLRAIEQAPEDRIPIALLAGLRRGQGDLAGAEALFRRLVEVDPSFTSQNALAGFLAQDPTRDAEAEAAYREAIASAEADEQAAAYVALADFLAARQRSDEAAQLLTEGIAALDDPVLTYKLGRLYHLQGNFEKATETIQQAAEAQPDDPAPVLALAQYRASIGDYEAALQASDQAVELDPASLPARVQKAEILVDSGIYDEDPSRIAEGRAIVEAVLLETPSAPPALYVRGRAEIAEERLDEAVETLSLATSVAPDWAPPHAALGSILLSRGDAAGARRELLRAAQLEPTNFAARGLLARTYAILGDWDLAIREARAIVDVVEEPGLRLVIVQSLARQGRLDQALQEFERLPEDERGAEAWYLAGRIRLRKGDSQGARAAYLRAAEIAEQPRFELLKQLLRLDAQEGRVEESAARIRAAAEARPEDGKLAQLLGQVAYLQGDAETAEAELRRATELAPDDPSGYEVLARFLAQTGRGDEVVATLEAALERSPDQASLHLALASLYKAQGRTREAMQRYEDAVRLDPSLVHAKNNLAYLIVDEGGDLGRALELAQQAKAGAPNDPRVADTLGWVLYKRGVPEAAVGYLREAEAGLDADDPTLPVVRQHLALAYEASGDLPAARELVERALADLEAQRGQATAGEPASVADLRAVQERLSRER